VVQCSGVQTRVRANVIIRHPFFGGLTPAQTLRSIVVHARHHLRIAREIIAAR
jgi:hypothetical protein